MRTIFAATNATVLALALSATASFASTTAGMDDDTLNTSYTPIAGTNEGGGGFHFQATLTYVNLGDLEDAIEAHNPWINVDTIWPIGLGLGAFYDFDNGLAVGVEVGPAIIATGDASFWIVPVGLDVRYTFMTDSSMSPFVRAGVQQAFAGGDFIESGSLGFYAKVGLEFGHANDMSWGIEAGYSSATVDVLPGNGFATEEVEPYNFTIGVFARF